MDRGTLRSWLTEVVAEWEFAALLQFGELWRNDPRQGRRVAVAWNRYERDEVGDVKKLQGYENRWRLRVGDWRVIFDRDGQVVTIVRVANRRDAYD